MSGTETILRCTPVIPRARIQQLAIGCSKVRSSGTVQTFAAVMVPILLSIITSIYYLILHEGFTGPSDGALYSRKL